MGAGVKTFPAGLDTLLATGTYVFADLYDFTLTDAAATHLRYTTADTDILYGGNVYTSKGPFVDQVSSQSRGHWKAGLDIDTWTVTIAPSIADPITSATFPATIYSQPWLVAARVGALDGATVDIHRVYWAAWPTRPLSTTAQVPTTFDSAFLAATATLSSGNLAVVDTHVIGLSTRSVLSESTGKFYCEFTYNIGTADSGVGFCNSTQALNSNIAASLNSLGYFSDGNVWINSVPTAIGAYVASDVVGMAVDIAAQLVWFRKNAGNWNASGVANPATGVGGISFAGQNAGPYYAAAEARANDKYTANFGATAYANAAPSGFGNWAATVSVATPYLIPSYTLVDLFAGRVADIQVGRTAADITINSWVEVLQRPMPRNLYGSGCRHTLFDAGCALTRATFAVNGTVVARTDDSSFTTNLVQADGYFNLGMLTWATGGNTPFSRSIRSYVNASGAIQLIAAMPYLIVAGDTFTAYPGCNKTQTTCANTFANLSNFGGFPTIPVPESAA